MIKRETDACLLSCLYVSPSYVNYDYEEIRQAAAVLYGWSPITVLLLSSAFKETKEAIEHRARRCGTMNNQVRELRLQVLAWIVRAARQTVSWGKSLVVEDGCGLQWNACWNIAYPLCEIYWWHLPAWGTPSLQKQQWRWSLSWLCCSCTGPSWGPYRARFPDKVVEEIQI